MIIIYLIKKPEDPRDRESRQVNILLSPLE
jgi:hypothetical protein